jgi:hypothetical protein
MIVNALHRAGRGHCGQCFTPSGCGNKVCGCHQPRGASCKSCHAPLFVAALIPEDAPPLIFTTGGTE